MIDVECERLLTFAEASKSLPGRPSIRTFYRWRDHGAKGRKLECVTIGGKVFTSHEALQRFSRQSDEGDTGSYSNARTPGGSSPSAIRTPRQRERAHAKAEKELARAGI